MPGPINHYNIEDCWTNVENKLDDVYLIFRCPNCHEQKQLKLGEFLDSPFAEECLCDCSDGNGDPLLWEHHATMVRSTVVRRKTVMEIEADEAASKRKKHGSKKRKKKSKGKSKT